jgi:hypothetical protein
VSTFILENNAPNVAFVNQLAHLAGKVFARNLKLFEDVLEGFHTTSVDGFGRS